MKVIIETIPNEKQRYPTVGDYWIDEDGTLQIRVSELGNDTRNLAVAIHELIEQRLCSLRGIKFEDIDNFDKRFEEKREEGNVEEPGNDRNAPYYREHRFSENIERQFMLECGEDWFDYDKQVNEL